jgi:hypothetical protein
MVYGRDEGEMTKGVSDGHTREESKGVHRAIEGLFERR